MHNILQTCKMLQTTIQYEAVSNMSAKHLNAFNEMMECVYVRTSNKVMERLLNGPTWQRSRNPKSQFSQQNISGKKVTIERNKTTEEALVGPPRCH